MIFYHLTISSFTLGITIDEQDSWSPSVPKEIVKSLKDKQVKRQEHIYEFIMTEKHHCQTLLGNIQGFKYIDLKLTLNFTFSYAKGFC